MAAPSHLAALDEAYSGERQASPREARVPKVEPQSAPGPARVIRLEPPVVTRSPLSAEQIRCTSLTMGDALRELEPVWRDLSAHIADSSPFLSWDFSFEWWRHFVRNATGSATGYFEIVVGTDPQGRVVAIAPFFAERTMGKERFGITLQPFGRSHTLRTMTDEPVALYRAGCEAAAESAVKTYIASRFGSSTWDIAVVRGSGTGGGGSAFSLGDAAGMIQSSRAIEGTMSVTLAPWGRFKDRLSKSMRDNLAYYPRKLSREVGDWRVVTARTPDEIAPAVEALIALHRRRSRSNRGVPHADHIAGNAEAAFLRAWMPRMAARRQASIVLLEIRGAIVAAQAFLEASGCVSVYYSGYDERWYDYSPLTIITAEMIKNAAERGVGRMDFPPGSTPWKSRWGTEQPRSVIETSFYSMRPAALARGVMRRLHQRLQELSLP
ncbi:MAG TPA: GNAT family N-acetyltransferase [Polyangia bacterium]|nr:GNAT family N-acetyltransferase [Polyangia bacterium]